MKLLVVLVLIAIVGLALWGVPAFSQTTCPYKATLSWDIAVKECTDGTPLSNCPVSGWRLEKQDGTAWKTTHPSIAATVKELEVTDLCAGTHAWRLWSLPTTDKSVASNVATKVIAKPAPGPAVLKTVDTIAYRVSPNWATFTFVRGEAIGTVALNITCEKRAIGEYHYVPKSKVTAFPGTSKPDYAVVRCG